MTLSAIFPTKRKAGQGGGELEARSSYIPTLSRIERGRGGGGGGGKDFRRCRPLGKKMGPSGEKKKEVGFQYLLIRKKRRKGGREKAY